MNKSKIGEHAGVNTCGSIVSVCDAPPRRCRGEGGVRLLLELLPNNKSEWSTQHTETLPTVCPCENAKGPREEDVPHKETKRMATAPSSAHSEARRTNARRRGGARRSLVSPLAVLHHLSTGPAGESAPAHRVCEAEEKGATAARAAAQVNVAAPPHSTPPPIRAALFQLSFLQSCTSSAIARMYGSARCAGHVAA